MGAQNVLIKLTLQALLCSALNAPTAFTCWLTQPTWPLWSHQISPFVWVIVAKLIVNMWTIHSLVSVCIVGDIANLAIWKLDVRVVLLKMRNNHMWTWKMDSSMMAKMISPDAHVISNIKTWLFVECGDTKSCTNCSSNDVNKCENCKYKPD